MLLSFGTGRQPSDWHVKESRPPMYTRIYWIFGGKTRYRSEGQSLMLQKSRLYLFPAHAPYELTTDPADPVCCLHLHLDLPAADLTRMISVSPENNPELFRLLAVIQDAAERQYPAFYPEQLAKSLAALCQIRGFWKPADPETLLLAEKIRSTYRSGCPVREIAASLGYSTEYFIRLFKKKLGVSPHRYAVRLRMSDAARMLAADASLDQIAAATGYADGHSLAGAFRRYYGISPREYREHYAGYA